MVEYDKSGPVTRREFYRALVVLWLYIALISVTSCESSRARRCSFSGRHRFS